MANNRTRRSFLDLLLGATATAWVATVLYPIVRFLKPLQAAAPAGPSRLDAAAVGNQGSFDGRSLDQRRGEKASSRIDTFGVSGT